MNLNMTVGPSFKGTFTLRKVEKLVDGQPIYGEKSQIIRLMQNKDRGINCALATLLEGDINNSVVVKTKGLIEVSKYLVGLTGKSLSDLFKAAKVVASGDLLNPKNMTFELKTDSPQVGDVHLFWKSDVPYLAVDELVKSVGAVQAKASKEYLQ